MALIVTGITVIETQLAGGAYQITLADPQGNQFHHSRGDTRALAIQGIQNYGYTVTGD